MNRKIVITALPQDEAGRILAVRFENSKETGIDVYRRNASFEIGNIYVGRVSKVVANINAAFVDVAAGVSCYFSVKDNPKPIFLNRKNTDKVCEGDLLLVQIAKEAHKTKAPVCTCGLNLCGKYVILTRNPNEFGISRKIADDDWCRMIKESLINSIPEGLGVVVRTDAYEAGIDAIEDELSELTQKYKTMLNLAEKRPAYTLMYAAQTMLFRDIVSMHPDAEDEIVTDDGELYSELLSYGLSCRIRLYEDDYPLYKNYDIPKVIKNATDRHVWLQNGGFLIIEPTEALTVIDVNTGKFSGHEKDAEETFLKINLTACKEIARQLVLRNISGIIIVDFISMKSKESDSLVMQCMQQELLKDPVKAVCVDYTRLGLMEITRKKIKAPLYEEKLLTIG